MKETYAKVSALMQSTSAIIQGLSHEELVSLKEPLLKLSAGVDELVSEIDKHGMHIQSDLDAAIEERDSIKAKLLNVIMSAA